MAIAGAAPEWPDNMYSKTMGSYDEIPEGMKRYINHYGCHFNKALCEEAVSRMYTKHVGTRKEYIIPYTKEQVENILTAADIKLKRNKLYDAVYVACMCKADYLGSSITDEQHLALFIKDTIDDPDAEEGFIFNRFYADTVFMNNPVDWEEMV